MNNAQRSVLKAQAAFLELCAEIGVDKAKAEFSKITRQAQPEYDEVGNRTGEYQFGGRNGR